MRADRLLSLLMLLQSRRSMTAQELATELEVSVRTIYRDVDALGAAGVPIYADYGPGGGFALLDNYRTSLTGLTEDEVRALFMLSIPDCLTKLGVSQDLKAAFLKLAAALPATRRQDEERVRQRIHLDWAGGFQSEQPLPHLQTIRQAVWEDRKLHLTLHLQIGPHVERVERTVAPYGLVAKVGTWHLVYARKNSSIRVHRVSEVMEAHIADEHFERPPGFDLATYWKAWCAKSAQSQLYYPVTVRVAPALVPELPQHFARETIAQSEPPDADGGLTLTLSFETLAAARTRLLGFGRAIEILEPPALRKSVADFAAQIVALYAR